MFNDYQFQTYSFNDYQWPSVEEAVTDDISVDGGVFGMRTYVAGTVGRATYVGSQKQSTRSQTPVGVGGYSG